MSPHFKGLSVIVPVDHQAQVVLDVNTAITKAHSISA